MTDQFPALGLGECLDANKAHFLELTVVTAAVTKGQVVDIIAVASDLPKVTKASTVSLACKGVVVAYLNGGSGAVGETVLVGWGGAFKVTAGTGGVTAGYTITSATPADELGEVAVGTTAGKVIGRGLQTLLSGDTGLVWID